MSESRAEHLSTTRCVLAWVVLCVPLVGVWCCQPWLDPRTFDIGQLVVMLLSWKIASLICLLPGEWKRLPVHRFLGYWVWIGMQPRWFLVGEKADPRAPAPTVLGCLLNAITGGALLWLVPYLLPAGTPLMIRLWIALAGFGLLTLFARLDVWALIFRALTIPVEKLFVCPIAATTLGEFWGQRWNRIVSGLLREVLFLPLAHRVGVRIALFAVFLYSGVYHEIVSFIAGSGYGQPTAYFLLQFLGVSLEHIKPLRRWFRKHPGVSRLWTAAVVLLPAPLFLHAGFIDRVVLPMFAGMGVPGFGGGEGGP